MKPAVSMNDFQLLDEFKVIAPCAIENEEYMDCALELASEILNRGIVGPLDGFVECLEARAARNPLS